MAFSLPGDLSYDKLTEQVWGLCYCASLGDVSKLRDYIEQKGLMLNSNRIGASALMLATEQGHVRALKTLIAAGADVNMILSEHDRQTPLMTAAERGYVDCLVALIEGGARVNETRYDGQTSLAIVIQELCSNDVTSIINAKTHVKVRSSMASLVMTANKWEEQHEECALLLIQAGADVGYTNGSGYNLLMNAAANGSLKILKAIIQAGGNINQAANDGMTALLLACKCTSIRDFRLYKDCVDLLLQAGAMVNAKSLDGKTAMILAVQNSSQCKRKFQRTDILQHLIKAKANINIQDKEGKTALIYAAEWNLTNICDLLVDNLADVTIQDNHGKTAYMYISDERCLQTILSRKIVVAYSKLKCKEYDQIYGQLGIDLNIQDEYGKTALIYAVENKLTGCCKLLINHCCNMNLQDNIGRTALMYASQLDCMHTLLSGPTNDGNSILPLIVVNPDIQDISGKTALMYAVEHNLTSCCQILARLSANVDIQDNDGKTALMYASKLEILQILLSNGAKTELLDNSKCSALVHLLRQKEHNSDFYDSVSIILEYGTNPVLDPTQRNLLQQNPVYFMSSLLCHNRQNLIRLYVCNGFVIHFEQTVKFEDQLSALTYALESNQVAIVKYLISNCYLCNKDMVNLRNFKNYFFYHMAVLRSFLSEETWLLYQQVISQPWPLVKLAFIAVSSALGNSPARQQRITQTKLPPRIQRMLMFQEPVSHLPVSEWNNIPLCFDPVEYEKLPKPRPLLYYWPFGRDLVI